MLEYVIAGALLTLCVGADEFGHVTWSAPYSSREYPSTVVHVADTVEGRDVSVSRPRAVCSANLDGAFCVRALFLVRLYAVKPNRYALCYAMASLAERDSSVPNAPAYLRAFCRGCQRCGIGVVTGRRVPRTSRISSETPHPARSTTLSSRGAVPLTDQRQNIRTGWPGPAVWHV